MTAAGDPAPPAPDGLVQLADGETLTYARLVSHRGGRVVVAVNGSVDLTFDGATARLVSPRGSRPPYRLAQPMPPFRLADGAAGRADG